MATEDTQAQDALATTPAAQNEPETVVTAPESEEISAEQAENQDEGTSENQPEAETDDKPRRQSGVQRLKQRLAQTEAELAQLKGQSKPAGEDIETRVRARLGEPPKEADFNGDYIAYERKLTAYETAQMLARADVSREIEREAAERESLRREAQYDHEERVQDARKRIPDFDKVVATAAQIRLSDTATDLIRESERGPEIMYAIAKNPKLAESLNDPSPIRAAMAFGELQAKLTVPQPKKATGAPPPSAAVRGGAAPRSADSDLDGWLKKTYPHTYK
jgi:hypothetical protein